MEQSKPYECVLFDMDGTLVDTYPGIFASYQFAMSEMKKSFGGETFVRQAIGAPLMWVFKQLCGMKHSEAEKAVICYRRYYAQKGKNLVRAYDGMEKTLMQLKKTGCYLGVATLKKELFAKEILKEQGLLRYFDAVCGMDENDRLTKADLIRIGMQNANSAKSQTVLVGDSTFDAAGAKEIGIDFLAVTYGFGFSSQEEAKECGAYMVAESAGDIAEIIMSSRKEAER